MKFNVLVSTGSLVPIIWPCSIHVLRHIGCKGLRKLALRVTFVMCLIMYAREKYKHEHETWEDLLLSYCGNLIDGVSSQFPIRKSSKTLS